MDLEDLFQKYCKKPNSNDYGTNIESRIKDDFFDQINFATENVNQKEQLKNEINEIKIKIKSINKSIKSSSISQREELIKQRHKLNLQLKEKETELKLTSEDFKNSTPPNEDAPQGHLRRAGRGFSENSTQKNG